MFIESAHNVDKKQLKQEYNMTEGRKLQQLVWGEQWDQAYSLLLNSKNPGRYLPGRIPLLATVCDRRAPPHLVDMVASLFPQDIIDQRTFHVAIKSIYRRATVTPNGPVPDTRLSTVRVLLRALGESLNGDKKAIEQALLTRGIEGDALRCAFHHDADLGILRALVEACSKALLDVGGNRKEFCSPRIKKSSESLCHVLEQKLEQNLERRPHDTEENLKLWEKIQYLYLEAYIAGRPKTDCPKHITTNSPSKTNYKLHAIMGELKPSLFSFALQQCPRESFFAKDESGRIPLHKACCYGFRKRYLNNSQELLRIAPETAKIPTSHGCYPLHLHHAMRTGSSLDVTRWEDSGLGMVVSAYAGALAIKGRAGMYPFQLAAARGASVDIIFRLLIEKPDVIILLKSHIKS